MKHILLLFRIIAAVILLQTLFFKFTGAPESIYIFTTLHSEPFGRWFAGFSELVAAVLLLVPRTQIFGALAAAGIMLGAVLSHLFILGISIQNDGGFLFILALIVLVTSLAILYFNRAELTLTKLRAKINL